MIVVIDHRDSFVWNLARYFVLAQKKVQVLAYEDISKYNLMTDPTLEACVFSPGPCAPSDMPHSVKLMEALIGKVPILGVCLGHQMIGSVFGHSIVRAKHPMHGQASLIHHQNNHLFKGCSNPLSVGRYHSLIVSEHASSLRVDAYSEEGEIMAISEPNLRLYGVQFHPESILTTDGMQIIHNFLHFLNTL